MNSDHVEDNRFLHLLRKRRKARAAALSTILGEPQRALSAQEWNPSPPPHSSRPLRWSNLEPSNLSTHYLFSSSHPQNEIQNPYPNCFEGYPKLQRYKPVLSLVLIMQTNRFEESDGLPSFPSTYVSESELAFRQSGIPTHMGPSKPDCTPCTRHSLRCNRHFRTRWTRSFLRYHTTSVSPDRVASGHSKLSVSVVAK